MKRFFYLFLLILPLMTVSCGDDEDVVPPKVYDVPSSIIGQRAMTYSKRKEIPAIKDQSMFIVHYYTTEAGIQVNFSIEWDKEKKTQRWAAYNMSSANNKKNFDRNAWKNTVWKDRYWSADPFQEDSIIPKEYRTTLSDHASNGYDRGHIVNSADRLCSKSANGQTFYLSNIQPQLNDFNTGIWLQFENKVNGWGKGLKGNEYLYIVKGGTTQKTAKVPQPFINDTRCKIPVPAYFFMAMLKLRSDGTYQAIGFWAKHESNKDTNVRNYVKSIDELEELTGIDFFPNLDDKIENEVEATYKTTDWVF